MKQLNWWKSIASFLVVLKCGSTVLTQGSQYNVTYNGSTSAGEAVAKITGIGDYAGYSKELTYTIGTKALPKDAGAQFSVTQN